MTDDMGEQLEWQSWIAEYLAPGAPSLDQRLSDDEITAAGEAMRKRWANETPPDGKVVGPLAQARVGNDEPATTWWKHWSSGSAPIDETNEALAAWLSLDADDALVTWRSFGSGLSDEEVAKMSGEHAVNIDRSRVTLTLSGEETAKMSGANCWTFSYKEKEEETMSQLRLVTLVVVDPDTALPLDERLAYVSPSPFLTDESDEALFHNVGLARLLGIHNDCVRTKTADPEWENECLKPTRIDGLQKKVITLTTF